MPITLIQKNGADVEVTSACIHCGAEQVTPATYLQLGMDHSKGEAAIALPPCVCGAQEVLLRTFDVHHVEHEAGHRKAVNALAEHLRSIGRVHPRHVNTIKAAPAPLQVGSLLGPVSGFVAKRRVPAPDAVAAAKAVLEAAKAAYAKALGAASTGTTP